MKSTKNNKRVLTIKQIKQAVLDGKNVYWKNKNYYVTCFGDALDRSFDLVCADNDAQWGLIKDDKTFYNGYEAKDFFIS